MSKAVKAIINYCGIDLEAYQLPNGAYTLSQSQVAKAIDKNSSSIFRYVQSEEVKTLPGISSTNFPSIECEDSIKPIKAIGIKVAILYWTYWASKGNVKAQALVSAGSEETLTRLLDSAFNVVKTEQQYNIDSTDNLTVYYQLLPIMQSILEQNSMLLAETQTIKQELLILRPAYEELQELNKSFDNLRNLKPLLEEISKHINKPNQKQDSLRGWLTQLGLSPAVDNKKAKAIGRLISDWLKVGNMNAPTKPAKYPEALTPLIKLATEYQLFHAR